MRNVCLDLIYKAAQKDERIVFIGSDLRYQTLEKFKQEMPSRFFMEGIMEASCVGMAAGLALSGHIVFINTIASFLARRSYEQILLDLALTNARVVLIGNGGGLAYAPNGATHMAFEDLALMRAIPNMTVFSPCDAREMEAAFPYILNGAGPVYIRLGKGNDPLISPEDSFPAPDKLSWFTQEQDRDVLILSYGTLLSRAIALREHLKEKNINAHLAGVPFLKPLDEEKLWETLKQYRLIVTLEEHSRIAPLEAIVSSLIARDEKEHRVRHLAFSLPDAFPEIYGSQSAEWDAFGFDAKKISEKVEVAWQKFRL